MGSPTPTGDRPGSLAFSPNGALLAIGNSSDTRVFAVSAGGTLTPAGPPTATGLGSFALPARRNPARDHRLLRRVAVDVLGVAQWCAISRWFTHPGRSQARGCSVQPQRSVVGDGQSRRRHAVAVLGVGRWCAHPSRLTHANRRFPLVGRVQSWWGVPRRRQLRRPYGLGISVGSAGAGYSDHVGAARGDQRDVGDVCVRSKLSVDAQCRLDTASFAPCTTPMSHSYTGLPEGRHTFAVRATDLLGNVADASATWSWTVDATPPSPVSLAQPDDRAASLRDSVVFSWLPTTDNLSGVDRYELWIDGAPSRTVSALLCGPSVCWQRLRLR